MSRHTKEQPAGMKPGFPWHSFWFGLVLALVLIVLGVCFERRSFGHAVRRIAHQVLHEKVDRPQDETVVILDLSGIAPRTGRLGFPVTSRPFLVQTVRELARLDPQPSCIVLDIDFSPESDGAPVTEADRRILCEWTDLASSSAGVPLVVGVGRQAGASSKNWLGSERYADLAAGILIADEDRAIVPSWTVSGGERPLWGLATAAVRAAGRDLPDTSSALTRVETRTPSAEGVRWATYLVDCRGLDALIQRRIQLKSPSDVRKAVQRPEGGLGGKIVLLGMADPKQALDNSFSVPGRPLPHPGVYLHACAMETLQAGYLQDLGLRTRLTIDLSVALLLVLFVSWIVRCCGEDSPKGWFLQLAVNFGVSAFVVYVGCRVLTSARVLWDGFVWIGLSLVLHRFLERVAGEGRRIPRIEAFFRSLGHPDLVAVAAALALAGVLFGTGFVRKETRAERSADAKLGDPGDPRPRGGRWESALRDMDVRPGGSPRGVEDDHRKALLALEQKRWKDSIDLLDQVLCAEPNHPTGRVDLADALLRWARVQRTRERLEAAEDAVEDSALALEGSPHGMLRRARLRMLQGREDEALEALELAVDQGGEEIRALAREDLFFLDLRDDERFLELTSEAWPAQAALSRPSRL